ncbi:PIG-L family deacetylase [Sphingomonas nostoxanthinifaciens]|uniref:PIG-L family deacetylase n=1 Tax=Sphingomonas nostoxanthinifaciens TaxID=2872652 RepID=UPI001CC1F28F|nr:PIG-L family deacetylase [Sphingomonas nostoxanthinifaciens]
MLVVAPHPDDEAIGAWGLMSRLRRAGAVVEVIVVSDGGASHPGSITWPRQRLVRARRRETLQAMRGLGLSGRSVRFLDLPDGQLSDDPRRLRATILRALHRRRPPDLIAGPDVADAHADHAAVAAALAAIRRRGEWRLGYHVWPEGAARGPRRCRVPLDGRALAAKRRIVRGYRTQTGIIADAQAGFAMTHRHLRAFVRPQECFAVRA